MGLYTSYYLYQKYEQRDGQDPIPCTPNVYSIDGQGTMEKVIKLDDDPECGYTPEPTEPIYRWYQIPITEDYICDECPELQYRWVESGTTCVGYDKWNRSIEQYSEDGGTTWNNTNPPVYSATSLIEVDSTDCGYVGKFRATYTTGSTYTIPCDSSSAITTAETRVNEYNFRYMDTAVVGQCVTSIDNFAFYYCDSLSSIDIPNSVTSIGNYAICMCTGLTSIYIPNSVTSIGEYTFNACHSLTSVNIPSSLTSISNGLFSNCDGLTSVTIPNTVTSIGVAAFGSCSGLTSITVEAATPPTLGNEYVFDGTNHCPIYVPCGSVNTYKNASNWSRYASRITCIEPAFDGKWLATYSDSHTESAACSTATSISEGEILKTNLVSVRIGSCVTSINQWALDTCPTLTSVTIGSGVTAIGSNAFYACRNLPNITIPSSVTYIDKEVFYGCTGLTSVTVEATTPPTLGNNVFNNTNNCPIYVPAASVSSYQSASGWSDYASRIQAIP